MGGGGGGQEGQGLNREGGVFLDWGLINSVKLMNTITLTRGKQKLNLEHYMIMYMINCKDFTEVLL